MKRRLPCSTGPLFSSTPSINSSDRILRRMSRSSLVVLRLLSGTRTLRPYDVRFGELLHGEHAKRAENAEAVVEVDVLNLGFARRLRRRARCCRRRGCGRCRRRGSGSGCRCGGGDRRHSRRGRGGRSGLRLCRLRLVSLARCSGCHRRLRLRGGRRRSSALQGRLTVSIIGSTKRMSSAYRKGAIDEFQHHLVSNVVRCDRCGRRDWRGWHCRRRRDRGRRRHGRGRGRGRGCRRLRLGNLRALTVGRAVRSGLGRDRLCCGGLDLGGLLRLALGRRDCGVAVAGVRRD